MPARVLEPSMSTIDDLPGDSYIHQFTDTPFDPVAFINESLPILGISSIFSLDQARAKESSLLEVSTKAQSFLTKVNVQNIRYASTLSQLTDEILRSGGRLAYEVEVLRGDANALYESLTDILKEDIQRFTLAPADDRNNSNADQEQADYITPNEEPEFIDQLRTLGQVKARLEEVINVFGEAMKWPSPPSEVSLTSSLISVSAPEPESESGSSEQRGKEFAKRARAEITELLNNTAGRPDIEAAIEKVEALRMLSTVWKGTAEERARNKLVDSLNKLVEDRMRQIEARSQSQSARVTDGASASSSSTPGKPTSGLIRDRPIQEYGTSSGGLFRNLQRLRDEIYLD